jgi:DNA-binding transcriptional MocR family regulator
VLHPCECPGEEDYCINILTQINRCNSYIVMMTMWVPNLNERSGPRYLAIADCLAESIAGGRLSAGDRLPPQRDLADTLGLTLGTVTRAYAEARKRGLVRAQVGRGTYVLANDDRWDPVLRPGRPPDRLVDMGPNLPLHHEDPDLAQAVRRVLRSGDPARLTRYQPLTGGHADRLAGRQWLEWHGVEAEPDEIVVTAGAQHALMILLGTLGRRGSAVLCEESTYPGVKTAASLLGLELEPVAMDEEGLVPTALERAAAETRASLLYCMPTLQNPRTTTMSESRRREIVEVCRCRNLRIVEDDVHRLLQPEAPPPLRNFAPERTAYVTSTSKLLAGGLRVGYVALPPALVERLAFAVAASIWSIPPLMSAVAAQWIEDGTAEECIARKRGEAAARQKLAREILPRGSYVSSENSYFLWLNLPEPWTDEGFTVAARDAGVAVTPGRAFSPGGKANRHAVRVSLSAADTRDQSRRGLAILSELLSQERADSRPLL